MINTRRSLRSLLEPSQWLASVYLSRCDSVGAGTRTIGRPLIHNEGSIRVGRDTTLRSLGSPIRLTATPSGTISIGDGVVIDLGSRLFSTASVRIDDFVVVGPNVTICDRNEAGHSGAIVLEKECRVGTGASIIGPCRIGHHAVILAGSVVRADVAPRAVIGPDHVGGKTNGIAGMPARDDTRVNGVPKAAVEADPLPVRRLQAVLAADFTINELAELLAAPDHDGVQIDSEIAPFDQVVRTLMTLATREPKADLAVVWTRLDQVSPSFRNMLDGGQADAEKIGAEVDAFVSVLRAHKDAARFVIVPSWVLPPSHRGLGMLELRGDRATTLLMRMNLRLCEALAEVPNAFVLDAQRWLAVARDGGFDPKLWHAGKIAFTTDVLVEAAKDIRAALRGLLGLARKLIVLDLDDTLWGGIVGDVGWETLRLGGHDPSGEAFVQFQRRLIALSKRGIALAVVSKNEESTALEAMRSHPEMLIRPEMLSAYRINWRDKAANIVEIAQELNLGLQSVVFLDDNPVERGRVREALAEVLVPEWPRDPTHYAYALDSLRCFDTAHISAEDRDRNAMYSQERQRNSIRSEVSSIEQWVASLDLKIRFDRLGPSNLARAAQLLNKTNQMNLRTRRMSEAELGEWVQMGPREVWTVDVSDRFGHSGLTGILSVERKGDDAHLVDYVLSCRVMGRCVEETMLWAAKRRGRALGASRIVVVPIATPKNKPCRDFFARARLSPSSDGYAEPLASDEATPSHVAIEGIE